MNPTKKHIYDKPSRWSAQEYLARKPVQCRCSKCHRVEYDAERMGELCGMDQPDGSRCRGIFVPPDAV